MSEIPVQLKSAGWKSSGSEWRSPGGRRYQAAVVRAAQTWDRQQQALLSQAILEARAASREGERPLAVVVTKRATPLQDARLTTFARRVAPSEAWILCDGEGQFFPHLPDEPTLKAAVAPTLRPAENRATNLFSDTNQWLIKVMLAPSLPAHLLKGPRDAARNASDLARLSGISMSGVSRFLRALDEEGHLDRGSGALRISQPLELLTAWSQRTRAAVNDVRVLAVRRSPITIDLKNLGPTFARGLFDACAALGFEHVKGVPSLIYVGALNQHVFDELGVVPAEPGGGFDFALRTPDFPRSVFLGAVSVDGEPTTDIIQCWLDASHYRIRGAEQADYLWRKALVPALGEL